MRNSNRPTGYTPSPPSPHLRIQRCRDAGDIPHRKLGSCCFALPGTTLGELEELSHFFLILALPGHLSTADRGGRVLDHDEERDNRGTLNSVRYGLPK